MNTIFNFILGIIIGGFVMLFIICLIQINKSDEDDNRLEDDNEK